MSDKQASLDAALAKLSEARASWLVCIASALVAAPVLVFRYLPMADFPQYFAAASILEHLHDPNWGYAAYYDSAFGRTLSWLPYALLRVLSIAIPLQLALRMVVFVSLLLLPLGVSRMLAAAGKPRLYALLMFPLVYSSQFYWGLIASNLSLGMALWACGSVMSPSRTRRQELRLCGLAIAIAFTHLYGLLVLLGFAWLWLRRSERQRWPVSLWPATALLVPWAWFAAQAHPFNPGLHPNLSQRVFAIEDNLLGGFLGPSESLLLAAQLAALALLCASSLPRTAAGWAALPAASRVIWLCIALSGLAYLVLPLHLPTALWINTRPAVLCLLFAPLLVPAAALRERTRLATTLPLLLAAATTLHAFVQLHAFDAEARDFDAIVAAAQPRAKLIDFIQNARGDVAAGAPYVQFGAYVLARRGGYLGRDFFGAAWSLPVRVKAHKGLTDRGPELLTSPEVSAYDALLVRGLEPRELEGIGGFAHSLIAHKGAWSLYRPAPAK